MSKLDFVIKMPFNLFSEQGRTVNTSIFGFTKTPHNKTDDVLYYNLANDGLVGIQHKGRVDKNNEWEGIQNSILDAVQNGKELKDICKKKKIYHKDNILNCSGVERFAGSKTKLLKIGDLFASEKGSLASEKSEHGDFNFITGAKEWKTHTQYTHDKESLVYVTSASGSLGRCHQTKGKFIASNLCYILTAKNPKKYPVNLQFYNALFNKKRDYMVSDLADGTSKLTIGITSLEDYYIEYIPIKEQNKFVKNYINGYIEEKNKLEELIKKSKQNIQNNLDKLL